MAAKAMQCSTILLGILLMSTEISLTSAKIVEGSMWNPGSTFSFLTRFCFQSGDESTMKYSIRYPSSYCARDETGKYKNGCQKLVLYYDEKDQWDRVYKNDKLQCAEKLSPELLHDSQIINLDPLTTSGEVLSNLYDYIKYASGCWEVTGQYKICWASAIDRCVKWPKRQKVKHLAENCSVLRNTVLHLIKHPDVMDLRSLA